ncbi:helix-turn-helix transcriptional regulator [Streptomyces nigra]|uniref:helix-turn-helix domain-containing protein n=1 Tax=Streptomyces nigra TaxID=1827580 RepID=UPI00345339BB
MADVTRDPEAWARLGAKIRERRESMGMSRRQLSERAGVSEKSIQVAEDGRTPRARWPQSLRLIERALHWEPDSMLRILEGEEPELIPGLFSMADEEAANRGHSQVHLFPGDSVEEALPLQISMRPTNHTRSVALAALPKGLRETVAEVLQFGVKARSYGADPDLAEEYERAAEQLLLDLLKRVPLGYQGSAGPGRLDSWSRAMRMDPVLRKEKEERARARDRERRRLTESPYYYTDRAERTNVVGDIDSRSVMRAIRELADEVARLSAKVDVPMPEDLFDEDETSDGTGPSKDS